MRASHRTLKTRQYNRPLCIPLAEDITALNTYLQKRIQAFLDLTLPDTENLQLLQKHLLCLVFAFNRRRTAEASRLTVKSVNETKTGDLNKDIVEHLSQFEQKLARVLTRIEVRGKKGRTVPILLTPLMKQACQVLCDPVNRQLLDLHPENDFLFAVKKSTKSTYRGCDVLREYSQQCGAKEPSLLRGTKMRKQLAIMT